MDWKIYDDLDFSLSLSPYLFLPVWSDSVNWR